jgi:hypothetical protein
MGRKEVTTWRFPVEPSADDTDGVPVWVKSAKYTATAAKMMMTARAPIGNFFFLSGDEDIDLPLHGRSHVFCNPRCNIIGPAYNAYENFGISPIFIIRVFSV